mgnify:CR=1 FL=1
MKRTFFLIALIFAPVTFADNPFNKLKSVGLGSAGQRPTTVEIDPERAPLLRWSVEDYIIMGVLLSEEKSIAILRTPMPHAQVYLVRKGDLLGDRDGVITRIGESALRVVIRVDGEAPIEKDLAVRNRGVIARDED